VENKQEIKKTFNKVLQRQIPEMFRQSGNNLQIGVVVSFDSLSRNSVIRLKVSGQTINNPKISKSITTLRIGDEVIILSTDSSFTSRNYIVASFGGNFANTLSTGGGA
jgi:hypothetical protein